MKLKLIALLLAVCLLFSCLTACGTAKPAEEVTTPEETTAPAEETPEEPAEEPAEDPAVAVPQWDYAAAYAKYAPDAVVYTVDGAEVHWSEYFAWLCSVITQLTTYYGITDWDTELDADYTCQDYIREYAESMSCEYAYVAKKAEDLGISLSAEEMEQVDAAIQEDADNYYDGDLDALYAYLSESFYTKDYYRFMNSSALLYQKIFESYFGEKGSKLTDQDVLAWLTDGEYIYAKHILIKTVDDTGAALPEEQLQEKTDLVVSIYDQLKATPADQLEAKFDELMAEYSEDPGLATNPDGYYFQHGQMVEPFELAALELKKNTFSDLVESDYGFHILYSNGMDPEHVFTYATDGEAITVRYQAANALFSQITADWTAEMEIVYEPEFKSLDLNALFGLL